MKKSLFVLRTVLILSSLLLLSNCGELQKAIEKVQTQNVDFSQGIYDGEPARGPVSLPLTGSETVSNTGPADAGEVSLLPIAENILALQAEIPEVEMGLSGTVVNNSPGDSRLIVLFSPSPAPGSTEMMRIGSAIISAGRTLGFSNSSGFEQSPEEVRSNLKTFFNRNSSNATLHVFLQCENNGQGSLVVHNLAIDSSPVFAQMKVITADVASSSGGTIKDIVTVSVEGTLANQGNAPAHFVWVVGPDEDNLTMNDNLVIDVVLDPGESIGVFDSLVVPDGLHTLKSNLRRLADGNSVKGILFVASDENVNADISRFKINVTAKVGM